MKRELVIHLALLLTLLAVTAQSQPDPNAFSVRHILGGMTELANGAVQMVRDPNTRPWVAVLALGVVFVAVVPLRRATRRRYRH